MCYAAQWRGPPRILRRQAPSDDGVLQKALSQVIVPPRAQASSRCETQASLRRQAAKLAFRSLDPFRALREPDCRRLKNEKRPFPLRTKNCQHNPKQPLDRKSPIQVRRAALHTNHLRHKAWRPKSSSQVTLCWRGESAANSSLKMPNSLLAGKIQGISSIRASAARQGQPKNDIKSVPYGPIP